MKKTKQIRIEAYGEIIGSISQAENITKGKNVSGYWWHQGKHDARNLEDS